MNQIKIQSQQLVAEALSYMHNGTVNALPVYDKGQFVGKITYEELTAFLEHKGKKDDIYAHKLNFDIETAMLIIKRSNPDLGERIIGRRGFYKQLMVGLSSVAVVSLLLVGVSRTFFTDEDASAVKGDDLIVNAASKTMLTLVNGRNIALNDSKTGLVVGGAKLTYSDGSTINYQQALNNSSLFGNRDSGVPIYNRQMVLNVPAKGMYRLVLPDGSKVWLNAASRLKFPVTFDGATNRRVFLNGEAYFEISKGKTPFIVVTNMQEIEVLGTHFNVSAYDIDKAIKTTLIEGSVQLRPLMHLDKLPGTMDPSSIDPMQFERRKETYGKGVLLKPNQEATLIGDKILVKKVDATESIAWTDGEYIFRNASLETVMHTITRWYDMEVVYEHKKAGSILLGGAISRSSKISDVLKMIELTANVHFKLEEKRIIVVE